MVTPPDAAGDWQELSAVETESSPHSRPISNLTSTGKYQFVELTPEETARRVAMIEQHQRKREEIWNALSPEEQAESDRQFEHLYKLLEEVRK